ncbi:WS/DGAT/MGAT family O-acyltransferase [Nocardioides faecalis]|uniref:WS/DGAT/MGAT family O-acyltransferase n=1 Tax=Nocardioides faecalis TaxID=2803858 RepID=UPI0027DE53E3|nr:wax ester/triacylglycerol synthase family O-acyltransferase [Nocardioides faecalis]
MASLAGLRPIDPTATAFLLAESRKMPIHVGALHLYEPPPDAGPDFTRAMYEHMRDSTHPSPLFRKHPHRSWRTAGIPMWRTDEEFDIEHHLRHSALPAPGRVRELFELCGRLHSSRLGWDRPMWEMHVIEGLADGRVATYTKLHHALLDGVAAMRLLASVLSTDPERRGMPAPFADGAAPPRDKRLAPAGASAFPGADVLRSALSLSAEAAGMPSALLRTLARGVRNETSAVSLSAPRTLLNRPITGSRRVAAQDWPVPRLRAVARAGDATLNDVVLAMCSGAMRRYLNELDALPEESMVAMVPIGLNARQVAVASAEGGNAVGSVMVRLATDRPDPADRLATISASMRDGKQALATMTPAQIVAMSALGMAPAVALPMLGLHRLAPPPFNLIISNVPGPKVPHYWNGARLVGSYPLSIPIDNMALNITCTSYDDKMGFGLTGCRRTVPHLQRLLTHLDEELVALERAVGAS